MLLKAPPEGGVRLWLAVLGLSVDQLFAWGVLYYAYAALSVPMAEHLGISRSFVAGAFSVGLLVCGVLAGPVGHLLDRWGTREALVVGALAGGLALSLLASARGEGSLLLAFIVLGTAQALSLYEPAFRTVVEWCPREPSRSRALLLVTSIAGFASTVFLPLTTWLVVQWGWRLAVALLALALATVSLPVRLLLPLPRRRAGMVPERPVSPTPLPRSAAWLAQAFALHAFAAAGVSLSLVWQRVERGDSLAVAASVAGLLGAAQVPGHLVFALLRRDGAMPLPLLLGVQTVALWGLAQGREPVATIGVLLFGAASGMMTLERAHVLIAWYGRDGFGAHNGRVAGASMVMKATAPFFVELLHVVMSYSALFAALACVLGLGVGCAVVAERAHRAEG